MNGSRALVSCLVGMLACASLTALERTDDPFKVFQFPADKIPRVDGDPSDWDMVPESYAVSMDQMVEDFGHYKVPDPTRQQVKVKVGWVKGLNRLYFLYEGYKSYWDFALPGLHNDTFEIVVDGDRSGGPLIAEQQYEKGVRDPWELYFSFQNVHAQNYHIFTPAEGKDWCMVWGPQSWLKELPYANAAYRYSFHPGESGKLVLEFWITPFDYAGAEGPQRAVESVLTENKIIGLSWALIDYGDVAAAKPHAFWNLSHTHTMYGNASLLNAFRLMPLEPQFRRAIAAQWSFKVLDMNRRLVAFQDLSEGTVSRWSWDFGDGSTSDEQNPLHSYKDPGHYVVVLNIVGPAGASRRAKVWDVVLK